MDPRYRYLLESFGVFFFFVTEDTTLRENQRFLTWYVGFFNACVLDSRILWMPCIDTPEILCLGKGAG